jgi:hypothetical protein
VSALLTKFAALAGGGGRGGGGGGGGGRGAGAGEPNPIARLGQAKNGLMATMPVTAATTSAYNEAKADVPKLLSEASALLSKALSVSASLAKHNVTLTVPSPTTRPTSELRN